MNAQQASQHLLTSMFEAAKAAKAREDKRREVALETYQYLRARQSHLPHHDTADGRRNIDRLCDLLRDAKGILL